MEIQKNIKIQTGVQGRNEGCLVGQLSLRESNRGIGKEWRLPQGASIPERFKPGYRGGLPEATAAMMRMKFIPVYREGRLKIKIQTNARGRNIEAQSRIFEPFSPKRYWFRRIPI